MHTTIQGTPQFIEAYGTDKREMADAMGKAIADRVIADDSFIALEGGLVHLLLGVIMTEKA